MAILSLLRLLGRKQHLVAAPFVATATGYLLFKTTEESNDKSRIRPNFRCNKLPGGQHSSSTSCQTPEDIQTPSILRLSPFQTLRYFRAIEEVKESSVFSPSAARTLLMSFSPTVTVTSCEKVAEPDEDVFSEPARYEQCIAYHRSLLDEYRQKWDYNNVKSRTPTTTGWPKQVPTEAEIPMLEFDYKFASGKYRDDLQFRLAVYYLDHDVSKAFRLLQDLAVLREHADAMCLLGVVCMEGHYAEADPKRACMWFRRAADLGHMQACYEMGVALYTGEGVTENEQEAVEYFERAASVGHAAAAYMLGDCLLDGVGVIRDRAEALEWIVAAGEMGHRGARSRVLAVLEKQEGDENGEFTDGSRQTFKRKVEDEEEEIKWTEEDLMRLVTVERKFTIGGGSRNPVVLKRRRTVIAESRETPPQEAPSEN